MKTIVINIMMICVLSCAVFESSLAQPGRTIKVKRADEPVIIRSTRLPGAVVKGQSGNTGTTSGNSGTTSGNTGTSSGNSGTTNPPAEDKPAVEINKERKGPANI